MVTALISFVAVAVTYLITNKVSYERGFKEGSATAFRHGYQTGGGRYHA